MIVLRISALGRHRDVRLEMPRVVVGSDPAADLVETDVGWAAREVELIHRGTEVELRRIHRSGDLRMRVGDEVRIGHARLSLVGLLPLPATDATEDPSPDPTSEPSIEVTTAGALFGGYEEDLPRADESHPPNGPNPFALVDELAEREPAPPPKSTPDPEPAASRPAAPPRSSPPPKRQTAAPPRPKPEPEPSEPPPSKKVQEEPQGSKAAAALAGAAAAAGDSTRGLPPLPRPPTPAFRQASFGDEIYRQLKRAPFFFLSVGLHLLVFLVMSLLQIGAVVSGPDGERGTIHASMSDPAERERVGIDEEEEPDDPIPVLPEIEEPPAPEDQPQPLEPPSDGDTLEPLPVEEAAPLLVGLNPSLSSVKAGKGRQKQRITPAELKQVFSKREATTTNERAADYVRGDIGRGSGHRGRLLETVSRNDILVIDGTFDKIGRVLFALKLPFVRVSPRELARKNAPDLSQHKVIFWNCGESLPEEHLTIATRRLRSFVKRGGYLFTTDWAVGNVLGLAFPGYLRTNGPRLPLPEVVVDIEPARGQAGHRLLDGVFPRGATGQWWLEQASFDVIVTKQKDVTVLITSRDLKSLYRRSPVVAATFPYDKGQVLHVMGHYYQEMGNLAGAISAQRLALNFVLMRLEKD